MDACRPAPDGAAAELRRGRRARSRPGAPSGGEGPRPTDTKQKTSSLAPNQKSLGHRVDLGNGRFCDRIDACFHLRERLEWFFKKQLRVLPRVFHQVTGGHDAVDETQEPCLLCAVS